METRGIIADWDPGGGSSSVVDVHPEPTRVRGSASRASRHPRGLIRVVMGDVGGGFGQKMFSMREEHAVVIAA